MFITFKESLTFNVILLSSEIFYAIYWYIVQIFVLKSTILLVLCIVLKICLKILYTDLEDLNIHNIIQSFAITCFIK